MAPRLDKNLILYHFDTSEESEFVKCKICRHALKRNRVYNLKAHLLKMHQINFTENETPCGEIVKKVFRKQTIKIEISKKQLFRSYVGLVTENNVPFNVLDSDNMRNIIDPICHGLGEKFNKKFRLNSSNCKSVLKLVSNNIKENIKQDLKQRLISLKIDSASRLSRNIFGISAQYIKNGVITSTILGMVELKGVGSSTSPSLATEILKVLTKYNVNLNQIVSITSDNGANMIKTTKILSHCSLFEEFCEEEEEHELNEVYVRNIDLTEVSNNMQLGDIQICRCAAHTAQLCAVDVTRKTGIKSFIINCRNLVKFIKKKSNGYREIFELKKFTFPQLDCPTRWGSTYNMLKNLYKAKEVLVNIESIKNKSEDENFELGNQFWEFVESYCMVFEPLQKSIIKFQEEQLHYGNFYAQWLKCNIMTKKVIDAIKDDKESFVHKIGNELLRCIDKRTVQLVANEGLNACLFLDPRFCHTLTAQKKQKAIFYLKKLYDRIKAIASTMPEKNKHINDANITIENPKPIEEDDKYLNEYLSHIFEPNDDEDIDVYLKIENLKLPFRCVETNVLEFWKEREFSDPELCSLADVCFAIPPTQVTIERAFSFLKLILTDNRNRLNQETLESILMVKLNPTFLNSAIDELPLFEDIEII